MRCTPLKRAPLFSPPIFSVEQVNQHQVKQTETDETNATTDAEVIAQTEANETAEPRARPRQTAPAALNFQQPGAASVELWRADGRGGL